MKGARALMYKKNRILYKLRSQTGASITIALLLFVVCGIVCSIILSAATAASGRMSGMAETDQRYYAVTSAAELLKDVFKEHPTVSIVKVVETPYTTTYTNGAASSPEAGDSVTKVYLIADKKSSEISERDYKNNDGTDNTECLFMIDSEYRDSYKIDTIQKDAAKNVYNKSELAGRSLALRPSSSLETYSFLAVTVSEDLDENGNITLTLYNTKNSKGTDSIAGERYTLVLFFGVDRSDTSSTKTENESPTAVDENSYKVVSKTTETTITSLTWSLTGIKTSA